MSDDARAQLADLAAALHSFLEWHQDAGTVGFPRRAAGVTAAAIAPASAPAPGPAPALDRHARLPQLAAEVAGCTKCALSATRTQTVFARGNPDAQICFVGEAPGADEDAQGL